MAAYSVAQVQSLMRSVGWPENIIPLMAAVVMAESSGRTDAIGTLANNEYSVGLFQINTRVHHRYSVEQLKNPVTNAREGLTIYRSQGLRAWGSYTDGRYRAHLAASQRAYGQPVTAPAVAASPGVLASFGQYASPLVTGGALAVQTVGDFFWHNFWLILTGFAVLALVAALV